MNEVVWVLVLFLVWVLIDLRNRPAGAATPEACALYSHPIYIPLEADANNIFTFRVGLSMPGKTPIVADFVADTGSHSVLIDREDCALYCQEKTPLATAKYGSQTSSYHVQPLVLTVEGAYATSCKQGFEHKHVPWLTDKTCTRVAKANVKIATSFSGTSDYNIVGLGPRSEFLTKLIPGLPRAVVVHVYKRRKAALLFFQPGKECLAKNHFLMHQNGTVSGEAKVNDSKARVSILFDTGSNCLTLPSQLFREKGSLLNLSMPGTVNEHLLSISYNHSNWSNRQVLEHSTNTVIIGVTFLRGYSIGTIQTSDFSYLTLNRL
jgi:hypothetical protein